MPRRIDPPEGPPPPSSTPTASGGAPAPRPERRRRPGRLLRLLVPAVALGVVAVALQRIEPPPPGEFYELAAPLPPGPPGTLIRHEETAAPPGARAWRVLYVSSGAGDDAVAVSAMVFAPDTPAPAAGRPVVAWAHPTTGVATRCAPSLRAGGGAGEIPGLGDLIRAGYVVTATDYPGLGTAGPHPLLVGEREASAVLDSVRAARVLPGAGAGGPTAVWGHGQGGHAALFAAQLGPTYAPDVPLAGVAVAAPVTDLTALLQHDMGGVAGNTLAAMALVSWAEVHQARDLRLEDVVGPLGVPLARRIAQRCITDRSTLGVDLPDAEVLRLRFERAQPWNAAGWDEVLAENTPGATPAGVPVLVAQGTADTVVWRDVTARWVAGQCGQGAPVTMTEYDTAGYGDIGFRSAADARRWLADRFAGAPPTGGCAARATAPAAAPLSVAG